MAIALDKQKLLIAARSPQGKYYKTILPTPHIQTYSLYQLD